MASPIRLTELAASALDAARRAGMSIVTAESCTAGRLAWLLSEAPGAAEFLHGGYAAYTKANKAGSLGVSAALLETKGAVCDEVALAMAQGALVRSPAQLALAITGVAGPEPDEDGNPVGLVCIAVACRQGQLQQLTRQYGKIGRDQVCNCAMQDALELLVEVVRGSRVSPPGSGHHADLAPLG